ncbi:MAG: hypothetical protein MZV63_42380 [Marinilabiliales bacterium]|nr:hypothetical protein [Marinilabiliales bacterium]
MLTVTGKVKTGNAVLKKMQKQHQRMKYEVSGDNIPGTFYFKIYLCRAMANEQIM